MQQFEGTFLDINVGDIEKKLESIGAARVGEYFYKAKSFDYPDLRLAKEYAWVRIRDEGDKVTMAFKKRLGVTTETGDDDGMIEHDVTVSSLEGAENILKEIGLVEKFYLEQKRISWVLGDTSFDIDTRPMLQPYLEIEASSDEEVDKAAEMLGLNVKDKKVLSATQIYNLAGIRDMDYTRIAFDGCVKRKK